MACSRPASLSCARRHLMDASAAKIYSLRGQPRRGGTRTGGVMRETLICINAFWYMPFEDVRILKFQEHGKGFHFPYRIGNEATKEVNLAKQRL
ncbi:hypothetical protein ACFX2A_038969 [Malus domestica]